MITKLGKQKLEQNLQELKAELTRTYEERAKAAAEGDLKENSAYLFYSERAVVLQTQIAEIMADLKAAVVQSIPTQNTTITFGHQITINFTNDNRQMVITLVGKNDAHLKPQWISAESPLGIALIGRQQGDTVDVNGQPVSIIEITAGDI